MKNVPYCIKNALLLYFKSLFDLQIQLHMEADCITPVQHLARSFTAHYDSTIQVLCRLQLLCRSNIGLRRHYGVAILPGRRSEVECGAG